MRLDLAETSSTTIDVPALERVIQALLQAGQAD
jgi:hypothetical protein